MHLFTTIFVVVAIAAAATEGWLLLRHHRHLRHCRNQVPAPFAATIPLDAHQRAADYNLAKGRIEALEIPFGLLILFGWTLGGGLDALHRLWLLADLGPILHGTLLLLSFGLISSLLALPFRLWMTFGVEQRFDFNRTTPALFISDTLKGLLIGGAIALPFLALILWLMAASGGLWWLWAWCAWIALNLLMVWLWPTLIAPLFNRFTPLENGNLRQRIEGLLQRCGFRSGGIFLVDGSRRSRHGNAYFTGLGEQKRIVFYDTLIERLDTDEIEAVLAHELGHFHHRHLYGRLLYSATIALAALAVLGWLSGQPWFYSQLGVAQASDPLALALFALILPPFTLLLTPVMSLMTRQQEYQADAFAARHSSSDALIMALTKLYRDNAATLTPDPLYSAFHDSHPPAALRIAALQRSRAL
jgi:STE24 endopeptidase